MLKDLVSFFTYLFAVYGLIMFASGLLNVVKNKLNTGYSHVRLVLMVKNQQEQIEDIIRSMFSCDILKRLTAGRNLTVVDMGSSDETLKILEKLKGGYELQEHLEVLGENEREEIFSGFYSEEKKSVECTDI